jgi:hypothetical protein
MSRRRINRTNRFEITVEDAARITDLPVQLITCAIQFGVIKPSYIDGRSVILLANVRGFKRKMARMERLVERAGAQS